MSQTIKKIVTTEIAFKLTEINAAIKTDLFTDEERLAFMELLLTGICKHCGAVTDEKCYCYNDG